MNAVLEVSRSRDFATLVASATVNGTNYTMPTPLPSGVLYWRVRQGSVQSPTWEVFVPTTDTRVMSESLPVHDFNGDGSSEIVLVFPTLLDRTEWVLNTLGVRNDVFVSQSATLGSSSPRAIVPATLVNAGDVNGDGFADQGYFEGVIGGPQVFALRRGQASAISMSTFQPLSRSVHVRQAEGVGDVNRDGFGDMVILTAPDASARVATHMQVVFGSANGVQFGDPIDLRVLVPNDTVRPTVTAVGDVDGDGFNDVVVTVQSVTSPTANRPIQMWVYYGDLMGFSASPPVLRTAPIAAGGAVVFAYGIGDMNGDGNMDIALSHMGFVGNTPDPRTEPVVLLPGSSRAANAPQWIRLQALPSNPTRRDSTVVGLGDINNDGLSDFAVGEGGVSRIYLGSATSSQLVPIRGIDRRTMHPVTSTYQSVVLAPQVTEENKGYLLTIDWGDNGSLPWCFVSRDEPLLGLPLPTTPYAVGVSQETRFDGVLGLGY